MACVLYLLTYAWLSGSVHLPIMLLLRWGGAKWRGLRWLGRTPRRWVWLWGSYGLFSALVLPVMEWIRYFPDASLEPLGWSGYTVQCAVYIPLLHMGWHPARYWVVYWLIKSLAAMVEGLVLAGLAALAWRVVEWIRQRASHEFRGAVIESYGIAVLVSAVVWGIANGLHARRRQTCADCFWPHGIPFTFYHEGGFAGGNGFEWRGVIGDTLVILLCGTILGWVWNRVARRPSTASGTTA